MLINTQVYILPRADIQSKKLPETIHISSPSSSHSEKDSHDSKVIEKNERLLAFTAILFSKPTYNKDGDLKTLHPAELSDEANEVVLSTAKIGEQARLIGDNIEAFASDISQERNYISRSSRFPFLSHTVITYLLQAHYHSGAIDTNMDSLKKSFSILTLLAPQNTSTEEYNGYVNSSKNIEIDKLLDQPAEKMSRIRKDVFLKGKQEALDDCITFIANIMVFARFWVKIDANDDTSQPLIIQMLVEIVDLLSSPEYRALDEKLKDETIFMTHTLISYIFNMFSVFVKMAKNPHVIRKFKVENTINPKEVKIAIIMQKSLLEQLQLCCATSSAQNIFAKPPISFGLFCPVLASKLKIQNNRSPPAIHNGDQHSGHTNNNIRNAPSSTPKTDFFWFNYQ